MLRIRKDDIVYVVSGKDKGKTGKVMNVLKGNCRVLVEGINRAKKHLRRKREDQKAGIMEVELPLHISNLQFYCKSCSKPARIGVLIQDDNLKLKAGKVNKKNKTRLRICKRCKEAV